MKAKSNNLLPPVWVLPLLFAAVGCLLDIAPTARDLPSYFVPMRVRTAELLASGQIPWVNWYNGCGEPWLANPQTGVLYPPAWLWQLSALGWNQLLDLEIAIHLSILSLGMGLLTKRLGGGKWGVVTAQLLAVVGPLGAGTAGMLNNLETLAWMPLVAFLSMKEGALPVLFSAAALAMGWLAGEPQLWVLGLLFSLASGAKLKTVAPAALISLTLASPQLVPFLCWVASGDRGLPGTEADLLRGGVRLAGLPSLVEPGIAASSWLLSIYVGVPILLSVLTPTSWKKRWPLFTYATACLALSIMPTAGLGKQYLALTLGMVRFPSKFAIMSTMALTVLGCSFLDRWLARQQSLKESAVLAGVALICLIGGMPLAASTLLAVVLAARLPAAKQLAVAVSVLIVLPQGARLFAIGKITPPNAPTIKGRVYVVHPSSERLLRGQHRQQVLMSGYVNLLTGWETVSTPAPLQTASLKRHLDKIMEGPPQLWWLDSAGANWLLAPPGLAVPHMVPAARRGELMLYRNLSGWSPLILVEGNVKEHEVPKGVGSLMVVKRWSGGMNIEVVASRPANLTFSLGWSQGWRFLVDGKSTKPEKRVGVLVQVPLDGSPGSSHTVKLRPQILSTFKGEPLKGKVAEGRAK